MTYQPPPPPPPVPPAGRAPFDPKSVNVYDWVLVGIGAFLLIFSFFGYWSWSYGPYSQSFSGWHFSSGAFVGWFAFAVGFASAGVVALKVFLPDVRLPLPAYVIAIGGFLMSVLLYVIGAFTISDPLGPGFSYILSIIVVLGGAVVALLRAQQTNTPLPGPLAGIPKILK